MNTRQIFICVALTLAAAAASGQASDPAREAAVDRYLRSVPVQRMLDELSAAMLSQQSPETARSARSLLSHVRTERIMSAVRAAMLQTFTADEINALAAFNESPHGASAMGKMGLYTQLVTPAIMAEMRRALLEMQQLKR